MLDPSDMDVTRLLAQWSKGDRSALDRLSPLVHDELRRIAQRRMRHERTGHTLQPTALVNELYLRLASGLKDPDFANRAQFFAACGQVMRHILVDYARAQARDKRGGGVVRVTLQEEILPGLEKGADVIALDEALETLTEMDTRKGRLVELRYFAGLTLEETAEVMGLSVMTVRREWQRSKVWLYRFITEGCAG